MRFATEGLLAMKRPLATKACWLLVIPYIGLLWVPFYNKHDPVLFGFPFFYWYQLALGADHRAPDLDRLQEHAP